MRKRRWMLFVDGENFTIRAASVADALGVTLFESDYYMKDVFVWMPGLMASHVLAPRQKGSSPLERDAIRAHYYTSLLGNDEKLLGVRKTLRRLGFQPHVFRRTANQKKSKGVDVTLTKDLLVNAFNDNYDVAVLIAGDGDYVPVIEELKRMGRTVYVVFFTEEQAGLNEEIRLSCDTFFSVSKLFVEQWKSVGDSPGPDLWKSLRQTQAD